jgi:hypothetical protein
MAIVVVLEHNGDPEKLTALKASGMLEASQSRTSRAYETDEVAVFAVSP